MEINTSVQKFAQQLLKRGIIVGDTETTGIGVKHQVIELALVDGNTDKILYDSFWKPTCKMDPEAFKVNGITPDLYETAPSAKDELPKVAEIVGDRPMGFYNAYFDGRMLKYTANTFGFSQETDDIHCVMLMYKAYVGVPYKISLKSACNQLDIEMGTAHRALVDTLAASAVLRAMAAGQVPNMEVGIIPASAELNSIPV